MARRRLDPRLPAASDDRSVSARTLQVTFINGRPLAAYFSLNSSLPAGSCATTTRFAPGMLIDLAAGGSPLGIEITAPSMVTLDDVNNALASLRLPPASREEVRPLLAA